MLCGLLPAGLVGVLKEEKLKSVTQEMKMPEKYFTKMFFMLKAN
jgi:hypothetical protein